MKKTMKKVIIALALVLAVAFGVVLTACGGTGNKTDVGFNEKGTVNNISATVISVKESAGNTVFKPASGKVFVGLQVKIENATGEEFTQSSLLSLSATADGTSVTPNVVYTSLFGSQGLDGKIADGSSMTGWTAVEVPTSWSTIKLMFKPELMSSSKITFTVSSSDVA